jgi:hypothetical protein
MTGEDADLLCCSRTVEGDWIVGSSAGFGEVGESAGDFLEIAGR